MKSSDNFEKTLNNGHAIIKDGIVFNINKVCYQSIEYECCMMALDDIGAPTSDSNGTEYSLVGRVMNMHKLQIDEIVSDEPHKDLH